MTVHPPVFGHHTTLSSLAWRMKTALRNRTFMKPSPQMFLEIKS
jgi:hypothetical protein